MTEVRAFFDAIAPRYDRAYALEGRLSRERMAGVLRALGTRRRVLALGLGAGRELPALLDAGYDVVGLDISPSMIALCNVRSRSVPIVQADFWEPLAFRSEDFDAVIALHGTLAHPPHAEALSRLGTEISRILRRGDGAFVAEVPSERACVPMEGRGMHVVPTGPSTFCHVDTVANVALDGVAFTADAWRSALLPLVVTAEDLGPMEYFLLGHRPP